MNSQAPDAFRAPRGMHMLSPPSKNAAPPCGPLSNRGATLAWNASSEADTTTL
jgi:hypothetical protein